jgi:hypothetical protein
MPDARGAARNRSTRAAPTRKRIVPRILAVSLRVTLPDGIWSGPFSTAHPDLHLDLIDRLELGRGLTLAEVRIQGGSSGDWEEELRALPNVVDVEVIGVDEESGLYRVTYRGDPFIPLLRKMKLLRHFPIPIQAGVATWRVVGPEPKVHRLLKELESRASRFEVVSVGRGAPSRGISSLTPRQKEVLRRALIEGYFDVPRRISLTELAPRMGVAISTLSVTLAVIEKKILEPFG